MRTIKLTAYRQQFYYYLLLFCIFYTANSHAQVVIDWNQSHQSSNIDFTGWNGEDLSATVVSGNKFRITKKANHNDLIINFISFDKQEWTARLDGDKFVQYPHIKNRRGPSHEGTRIDYIATDNSECSATISGNEFIVTNHATGKTYQSPYIYYITFNSTHWSAGLNKPYFVHWEGIADPKSVQILPYINYLTWNKEHWTATIMPDGSFKHTNVLGQSHLDDNLIYLNYDGSIWGARLNFGKFNNAPGFVPYDRGGWLKQLLAKFDASVRNLNGGGFGPQPTDPNKVEVEGTIDSEENGVLSYHPLDRTGQCTYDLNWFPESLLISKSKIGSCLNRDIYSIVRRKQ